MHRPLREGRGTAVVLWALLLSGCGAAPDEAGLPLKKGRRGTMTHDYKRNGTTTLFAALETLQGKVIGQRFPRHRHQEFLKFLRTLDKEFRGAHWRRFSPAAAVRGPENGRNNCPFIAWTLH